MLAVEQRYTLIVPICGISINCVLRSSYSSLCLSLQLPVIILLLSITTVKHKKKKKKKKKQRADKARHWVIHIHLTRASPPVHNNLTEIRLNPTSTHTKKGK